MKHQHNREGGSERFGGRGRGPAPEPAEAPVFPMRLNKYLAWKRQSSRREMDKVIEDGRVLVNGAVAALGTKVDEGDRVEVRFHGNKERAQGNQMAHARRDNNRRRR